MRIRFSRKESPNVDPGGLKVDYGPARRAALKWRWYLLLLLLFSPLAFLLWKVASYAILVSAPGVVRLETVTVSSPIQGVVSLPLRPGQLVRRGDQLFSVRDPSVEARLAVLNAELGALKSSPYRPPSLNRVDLSPLASQVQVQRRSVAYQREVRDRIRDLFSRGAATRAELDQAEDRLRQAEAALAQAEAALSTLKPSAQPASQFSEYEAMRLNRMAQIQAEAEQLGSVRHKVVTSPVDGVVLELLVNDRGSVPMGGGVVTLGDRSRVRIWGYLDPRFMPYGEVGSPVRVRMPDGMTVQGRVEATPTLSTQIPPDLSGPLNERGRAVLISVTCPELPAAYHVDGIKVDLRFPFSWRNAMRSLGIRI